MGVRIKLLGLLYCFLASPAAFAQNVSADTEWCGVPGRDGCIFLTNHENRSVRCQVNWRYSYTLGTSTWSGVSCNIPRIDGGRCNSVKLGPNESGQWRVNLYGSVNHLGIVQTYCSYDGAPTSNILYVDNTYDGFLNLRNGPGVNFDVVQRMYPGDKLTVVDSSGKWKKVVLENGVSGWAHSGYMVRQPPS